MTEFLQLLVLHSFMLSRAQDEVQLLKAGKRRVG